MRGALAMIVGVLIVGSANSLAAQDPPPNPPDDCPNAKFNVPPSLPPVTPRMSLAPAFPPVADPRTIFFAPYFYPTHYNFRPLPYGVPPTDPGFFYGTYANPYYNQYYGPGNFYGY